MHDSCGPFCTSASPHRTVVHFIKKQTVSFVFPNSWSRTSDSLSPRESRERKTYQQEEKESGFTPGKKKGRERQTRNHAVAVVVVGCATRPCAPDALPCNPRHRILVVTIGAATAAAETGFYRGDARSAVAGQRSVYERP